jgi:general stress protein CsbA
MLASYILPLICCGFNVYLGLVLFMVILLVGIAIIRGGYLHTCCIFLLKRYYVYSNDNGAIIITKVKMEKFNLEQRDNPNGIEARQIAKGIYLTCEN